MECDVLTTLNKIEDLRRTLYNVARDKSLSDPELVNISQKLDRLLNDFQALKSRKCHDEDRKQKNPYPLGQSSR